MSEVDRRSVILAAATVSTAMAAGSLSACSPVDTPIIELPGKFFAKVAVSRLVEAKSGLVPDATISIVTSEGAQLFTGRDDVTEATHRLLNVEGWSMIGDTNTSASGGFHWSVMGPWLCSDMVKGTNPQLGFDKCAEGFAEPVLNVLVGVNEAEKIRSILVLENRRLSGQLAYGETRPAPINK